MGRIRPYGVHDSSPIVLKRGVVNYNDHIRLIRPIRLMRLPLV